MEKIQLKVKGMVCEGCEKRVSNTVGALEGVLEVIANHKEGTVIVRGNQMILKSKIKERIEDIGFEVEEG